MEHITKDKKGSAATRFLQFTIDGRRVVAYQNADGTITDATFIEEGFSKNEIFDHNPPIATTHQQQQLASTSTSTYWPQPAKVHSLDSTSRSATQRFNLFCPKSEKEIVKLMG
jgi:hypothetical protein